MEERALKPVGMDAVLPVPKVAFDVAAAESGDLSNMTAEQYMAWVHKQAEALPSVVRAEVDTSKYAKQTKYMPVLDEIASCPEHLQPTEEWVCEVLYAFSELRQTLALLAETPQNKERVVAVPAMKDSTSWKAFCFGWGIVDEEPDNNVLSDDDDVNSVSDADPESADEKESAVPEREPELMQDTDKYQEDFLVKESKNRVLAMLEAPSIFQGTAHVAEVRAEHLLSQLSKVTPLTNKSVRQRWSGAEQQQPTTALLLQFDQVLTQRLLAMHTNWLNSTEISEAKGQWLYGLLARLEKPLYQDSAAVVRQLYRRCCILRSQLAGAETQRCPTFDVDIAALNVLISITGGYFRQAENNSSSDLVAQVLAMTMSDAESSGSSTPSEDEEDGEDDEQNGL